MLNATTSIMLNDRQARHSSSSDRTYRRTHAMGRTRGRGRRSEPICARTALQSVDIPLSPASSAETKGTSSSSGRDIVELVVVHTGTCTARALGTVVDETVAWSSTLGVSLVCPCPSEGERATGLTIRPLDEDFKDLTVAYKQLHTRTGPHKAHGASSRLSSCQLAARRSTLSRLVRHSSPATSSSEGYNPAQREGPRFVEFRQDSNEPVVVRMHALLIGTGRREAAMLRLRRVAAVSESPKECRSSPREVARSTTRAPFVVD